MLAQRNQLEQALPGQGWRILRRVSTPDSWWLEEAWLVESTWSPVGSCACISFVIDPEATSQRSRGEKILTIAVTKELPAWQPPWDAQVFLRPGWERRESLQEVLGLLANLRDAQRDPPAGEREDAADEGAGT